MMAFDRASQVDLLRIVPALGVAQIISWETLFYPVAVPGSAMRDE